MCTELRAADGVRIEAAYTPYAAPRTGEDPHSGTAALPADGEAGPGALVLAHGFTGALDKPALRRAATAFSQHAAVVTFSFRGHGRSGGHSTVGDREVLDLAAAVAWARSLGHRRVATIGFSMGGSVVLRHGALYRPGAPDGYTPSTPDPVKHRGRTVARESGGARPGDGGEAEPGDAHADAVVAVSAPARWYYRGTAPMRRLHWAIQHPLGRLVSRYGLRTRVHHRDWNPVPLSPVAAAGRIAPVPLLVVHGDQDPYFPLDHPLSLAEAADPEACELWIEAGFGHAENSAEPALLHRIGAWTATRIHAAAARPHHGSRESAAGTRRTQGTGRPPEPGTTGGTDRTEGTDG
ncbi:alpha/beta hydrolase [Streptomyces tubbatahanensis]|uniref:Alpha/beta hydrolase n=1 Tax=Streptomyces tubbatahanensis TaxID=2923272 RepID=A0ABY3Y2K9_9ACTN|nr:alpha/beta fold hydrolase [Streptomyces tubbatahanensis]UNT01072.1 alpha/beta hydrolase [Streptomyces tubbatahanensis]